MPHLPFIVFHSGSSPSPSRDSPHAAESKLITQTSGVAVEVRIPAGHGERAGLDVLGLGRSTVHAFHRAQCQCLLATVHAYLPDGLERNVAFKDESIARLRQNSTRRLTPRQLVSCHLVPFAATSLPN